MSIPWEIAPYCKGERCSNQLTSKTEYKRGCCDVCVCRSCQTRPTPQNYDLCVKCDKLRYDAEQGE